MLSSNKTKSNTQNRQRLGFHAMKKKETLETRCKTWQRSEKQSRCYKEELI